MDSAAAIPADAARMSGFAYGFGVSVGILLLITTVTLASYFCARNSQPPPPPARPPPASAAAVEEGLDESVLATYPKIIYSPHQKPEISSSCCSICLGDYDDGEILRLLPDCGHAFHLKCVDPWLRLHPTCPVCRASPLPSPLAEVVPLARRQS